jgi:hypothetical protein
MLSHQIFVLLVNNLRLKLDLTLINKTLSSLNNLGNRDHAVRILIKIVLRSFLILILIFR